MKEQRIDAIERSMAALHAKLDLLLMAGASQPTDMQIYKRSVALGMSSVEALEAISNENKRRSKANAKARRKV